MATHCSASARRAANAINSFMEGLVHLAERLAVKRFGAEAHCNTGGKGGGKGGGKLGGVGKDLAPQLGAAPEVGWMAAAAAAAAILPFPSVH